MSEAGGISRMGAVAGGDAEAPELGIGLLGTAFMCNAHTNAFLSIPHNMYPPVAIPRLVALSGRNEANLNAAADRYGYQHRYTRWQDMLENDAVQVFDNGGPNNVHAEPCIVAAQAGTHVLRDKPLARQADAAEGLLDAAAYRAQLPES